MHSLLGSLLPGNFGDKRCCFGRLFDGGLPGSNEPRKEDILPLVELFRGFDRLVDMTFDDDRAAENLPAVLKRLRRGRYMTKRHLADSAFVNPSVVLHAERGRDSRLSTWIKLFAGLGYRLLIDYEEFDEETPDIIDEERTMRRDRRTDGLRSGKRRWR
jgi:hypothetical protein